MHIDMRYFRDDNDGRLNADTGPNEYGNNERVVGRRTTHRYCKNGSQKVLAGLTRTSDRYDHNDISSGRKVKIRCNVRKQGSRLPSTPSTKTTRLKSAVNLYGTRLNQRGLWTTLCVGMRAAVFVQHAWKIPVGEKLIELVPGLA